MEDRIDILNIIAGRIANYVKNIGDDDEPCELCKGFCDYKGKCIGYSWDLTYFPPVVAGKQGTWNFSLYHHRKEIWFIAKEGTVIDIILVVYEKLVSGEWNKYRKDARKEKEDEKVENKELKILKAGCPVCLQEVDIYNDELVLKIENHNYRNSDLQCPGSGEELK